MWTTSMGYMGQREGGGRRVSQHTGVLVMLVVTTKLHVSWGTSHHPWPWIPITCTIIFIYSNDRRCKIYLLFFKNRNVFLSGFNLLFHYIYLCCMMFISITFIMIFLLPAGVSVASTALLVKWSTAKVIFEIILTLAPPVIEMGNREKTFACEVINVSNQITFSCCCFFSIFFINSVKF